MKWLLAVARPATTVDNYTRWVQSAGITPVVVTPETAHGIRHEDCAALLLTGGGDVNPARYSAIPEPETEGINDARDALELELVRAFVAADTPVFGICRGIQVIQVALGGSLIQHLPRWLTTAGAPEPHASTEGKDARHPVTVAPDASLATACPGLDTVNSSHHQALDPTTVPTALSVEARSPAGVIEAVSSRPGRPVIHAVQWHPERLPLEHPGSGALLASWVAKTSARRKTIETPPHAGNRNGRG